MGALRTPDACSAALKASDSLLNHYCACPLRRKLLAHRFGASHPGPDDPWRAKVDRTNVFAIGYALYHEARRLLVLRCWEAFRQSCACGSEAVLCLPEVSRDRVSHSPPGTNDPRRHGEKK